MKKGLGSIVLFFVVAVLVMGVVILADKMRTTDRSLSEIMGGVRASKCTNECDSTGLRECYDSSSYKACGNYDNDTCLEWGSSTSCPSGYICSGGACIASSTSTMG